MQSAPPLIVAPVRQLSQGISGDEYKKKGFVAHPRSILEYSLQLTPFLTTMVIDHRASNCGLFMCKKARIPAVEYPALLTWNGKPSVT